MAAASAQHSQSPTGADTPRDESPPSSPSAAASDRGRTWEITLENLTAGYDGKAVLRDVNAVLPARKTSVILGESGCGKSTLLRHILGLQKPMAGRVRIGGSDLFNVPRKEFRAVRRRMGALFQDGALLGSLTLGQNTALPLTEHGRTPMAEVERRVRETLALVGLEEFIHYHPSQLSGGMKKRGGLARAIVTDPPLLLCDEPTSGLDPINAASMDRLLSRMRQRLDSTMVVVSHDLESMMAIADHVLVLHEGRAVYDGDVDGLRASKDPYLQRFLAREPEA